MRSEVEAGVAARAALTAGHCDGLAAIAAGNAQQLATFVDEARPAPPGPSPSVP